jgi:hypothetical protein
LTADPSQTVEGNVLNKLVETIQDVQNGLDPRVLSAYYKTIVDESKAMCPTDELRDSIRVIQNRELPMKFEFKSSKRAIRFVIEAVEGNLNTMPFATRLYFQKFEEIMEKEYLRYLKKSD